MNGRTLIAVAMVICVFLLAGILGILSGVVGVCPVVKPDACVALYDPVIGFPNMKQHANSCVACLEGAWLWITDPSQHSDDMATISMTSSAASTTELQHSSSITSKIMTSTVTSATATSTMTGASTTSTCSVRPPISKQFAQGFVTVTIESFTFSSDGKFIHVVGSFTSNAPLEVTIKSVSTTLSSDRHIGDGVVLDTPLSLPPGQTIPFEMNIALTYSPSELQALGIQEITIHSVATYNAPFVGSGTWAEDETVSLSDFLCGNVIF